MHSFLVDAISEHKKAKGVNKNVVAKISHKEYKDVLLNNKCLRQSMNRIPSRNHNIHKIYLSCFDDKINIINIGYHGLALGY